jgi:hypothetical protein
MRRGPPPSRCWRLSRPYGRLGWFRVSVSMSSLTRAKIQSDPIGFRPGSTDSHISRALHILFIHRDANTVDNCSQELKKAQFTVSADIALNLAHCTEQLRSQSYDVVVAEYPSPSWKGSQGLQFLRQTVEEVPLLFVPPPGECNPSRN